MKISVLSPERVVYEAEDVEFALLPGEAGDLGVMPDHTPLLTPLKVGVMSVRRGGDETIIAIAGGFAEITPEYAHVLADAAELAEEIDVKRSHEAKQRAQQRLAEAQARAAEVDVDRARLALLRAINRLDVIERFAHVHPPA